MKRFIFIILVLCTASAVLAQTKTGSVMISGTATQIARINGSSYAGNQTNAIGSEVLGTDTYVYRTYWTISLTSIPSNVISIDQVTVSYTNANHGSYTLKLTQLATTSGNFGTDWTAIGNGTSLNAGLPYNGLPFVSSTLPNAIKNARSAGQIIIGALSEAESNTGSASTMTLTLTVNYTVPAAQLSITAQNNLGGTSNGGNIGVGIYPSSPSSYASPHPFTTYETKQLNLQAYDNQNVNGKNWVFQNWYEGGNSLGNNASVTSNPLTTADNNAVFQANFKTNTYTTSGTMTASEDWWSATVSLTGNLTIPSGVTLTIESGTTVNLNGYSLMLSGGSVSNSGTISGVLATIAGSSGGYFPSIQSAINYSSSGQTITLQARSYSESPSFSSRSNLTLAGQGQGSTIINGTVSITNSSGISVSNLTLNNLSLNNNTSTDVSNVTATSTTLATVYGGSGNEFYTVSASNIGASFGLTSYDGTGDVASGSSISNGDCGVYLTNNASYNVGTNDVFCSNGLDIDALNGAYAYSINNTYSHINPVSVGGNVVVAGNIWSCGGISSPAKGAKTASSVKMGAGVSQQPDPLQVADSVYLALLRQINADKAAKKYDLKNYAQSYNSLLASYKNLVNKKNDVSMVKAALSKLSSLYKAMGDNADFTAYMTRALASASFNSIQPYFERYLVWNYVDSNQYNNALKTAEQILASPNAGDDLKAEMLYEEGLIYKYYLADSTKANEMFASLSNNYPSSLLVRFADAERTISASSSGESDHHSIVSSEQAAEAGLGNYPNPFNPTTVISYRLKMAGHVTLRVYDVLGREVMTLVDGQENAGLHNVQFNGQNLASGIYLYHLTAPGVDQVKKMILMK